MNFRKNLEMFKTDKNSETYRPTFSWKTSAP